MVGARLDFLSYGYQIEKELGANRIGDRITYLATDLRNRQSVVIKLFQFVTTDASWSDYDDYEREIQILQSLDHPGIPRYLESFQTPNGFCMVQEYKQASSLAVPRSYDADAISSAASSPNCSISQIRKASYSLMIAVLRGIHLPVDFKLITLS